MKKQALYKNIKVEVLKNRSRFIAIFALISIGVFVFSGLMATGQAMRYTITNYLNEYQVADLIITTPQGINQDDLVKIKQLDHVKQVEAIYTSDVILSDSSATYQVKSLPTN
ncbi:MAG: hypothetical protein ACRCTA_00085, partial [Bacilli bacterium]